MNIHNEEVEVDFRSVMPGVPLEGEVALATSVNNLAAATPTG